MMGMQSVMTRAEIERAMKQYIQGIEVLGWDANGNLIVSSDLAQMKHEKYGGEEFYMDAKHQYTLVNKNGWKMNVEKRAK